MKITFEVEDSKIPEPFKDRPDIIFAFLHENLYVHNFQKAENNAIHKDYRKAFYDQKNLNGDDWVEGIEEQDNAKITFAKLLLDSIAMEQAKEEVLSPIASWKIMGSGKGKGNGNELVELYYSNTKGYEYEGAINGSLPSDVKDEAEAIEWMEKNAIGKIRVNKIVRRMNDKSSRVVAQWINSKSKVILSLRESDTNYTYDGYQCSGSLKKMANDELAIEHMEQTIITEMSKKWKMKIRRAKTCAGKTL